MTDSGDHRRHPMPPDDIRGSRLVSPEEQRRRLEQRAGVPRPPLQYGARRPQPRRRSQSWLPAFLSLIIVAAIGGILYLVLNDPESSELLDGSEEPVLGSTDGEDAASGDGVATDDSGSAAAEEELAAGGGVAGTGTPATPASPTAPYVQGQLVGKDFVLSGVVPNETLAGQIQQVVEIVYAPFVQSNLEVDPSVPEAEWLAAAPQAVGLLNTITEGTITVADGQIYVDGMTSGQDDVDRLQERLAGASGLPVNLGVIELTNRRETIYVIAGEEGQVALSGALPSEEIRMGLVEAAAVAYGGEENVFDASTVDDTVEPDLWMYNPGDLMAVLAAFPNYEVRMAGDDFSASLRGGATFDVGSTEIKPAFAQVLNYGAVVLTRDPAMAMTIEGHTDSDGPDQANLDLSQQRADAVVDYLVALGIDPSRLSATGKGETEPIAPNDTAENRALNRRVEFSLTGSDTN